MGEILSTVVEEVLTNNALRSRFLLTHFTKFLAPDDKQNIVDIIEHFHDVRTHGLRIPGPY